MNIDFSSMNAAEVYHLMTQTIIPRPIAWVLTDNGEGQAERYNLAPFSYFTAVSSAPPLVMISVTQKPDGGVKDTRINLQQRGLAVIHIAGQDSAERVNATAASHPFGVSEVQAAGLELVEQAGWALPRLAQCDIAMACDLYEEKEIGPYKQGLMFLEVKQLYVSENAITHDEKQRLRVDASAVKPLGRLGAAQFATFGEVFSLKRPS